jgi:hypothetical protein
VNSAYVVRFGGGQHREFGKPIVVHAKRRPVPRVNSASVTSSQASDSPAGLSRFDRAVLTTVARRDRLDAAIGAYLGLVPAEASSSGSGSPD